MRGTYTANLVIKFNVSIPGDHAKIDFSTFSQKLRSSRDLAIVHLVTPLAVLVRNFQSLRTLEHGKEFKEVAQ